jgi:hypothetical protein
MTASILGFASVVLFGQAASALDAKDRSRPTIDVPVGGATVPMLDIGGRPVVEIRVNGKGPFPFIFDTGATETVIDERLSSELALPSSDEGNQIEELLLGSARIAGLDARVAPVAAMFGKIDNPPRGVLSALAFPGYLVTFDYPRKQVVLRKGELPEPNQTTIVAYGADEMLPTVPVKVAGREMRVHLDTGAPFGLALPTKYKSEVPLTAPAQQKGKARTHAGEFPIFRGTVNGEVTIGQYKLATHEVVFNDAVPYPGAAPQGQVGYAALRDFAVTLDSANRRIEFAKETGAVSTSPSGSGTTP